ncbi:hypothetical protein DA2_1543 [Desulfovibrio sp. A2]|nr:hypothetical protein DA2_1543 [Desulfovibrio sp. A2]
MAARGAAEAAWLRAGAVRRLPWAGEEPRPRETVWMLAKGGAGGLPAPAENLQGNTFPQEEFFASAKEERLFMKEVYSSVLDRNKKAF